MATTHFPSGMLLLFLLLCIHLLVVVRTYVPKHDFRVPSHLRRRFGLDAHSPLTGLEIKMRLFQGLVLLLVCPLQTLRQTVINMCDESENKNIISDVY